MVPSPIMTFLAVFLILIGVLREDVFAQTISSPVKALYGFSPRARSFRGKTPKQMAQTLQQWGITAVFGGYEDSSIVAALHDRGIRIFAEVPLFVGKHHWKRNPQSRPILSTGQPMPPEGWYYGVNPVIPEIRKQKLKKIRHLIRRFPVDGVWLDFIRWPCRWDRPNPQLFQTSFDSFTLGSFQKDTGIHIPPGLEAIPDRAQWILRHHRKDWTGWKCQQINDFVRQTREIVDGASQRVVLGLFGIPWDLTDFEGAIQHVIGQDYQTLSAYVDVFSPMVYHKLCGKDVPWIAQVTTWIWKETGKTALPIVQAVDEPEPLNPREFRHVLKTALATSGSQGAIIFNLSALSPDKVGVVKEIFGEMGAR